MAILGRLATVLAGLALAETAFAADRKPNILVIVADDFGYGDIGVQGCRDIPTPNIDSLAKNGVRCSSGYVSGPYCSPTRAGLMTGRYQQRFGHEFNPGPAAEANRAKGLSLDETTLPQLLKNGGYATGMVGKWHLGYTEAHHPQSRGFQEFFGFLGGAHSYIDWTTPADPILRGRTPAKRDDYLTDAFAREAVAFIDRHQQEPFFLYLAFNAVHTPMQAPEKYTARFQNIRDEKRRTYAGMVSAMDDAIGAVLKKLRDGKIEEQTLVFFISDNGGPEEANASDNGPLRGGKATTWEGGVRVPFLVQWTGHLPAGKVYEQPVIQLDILPTALAVAGVEPSSSLKLDGVNLLPYLEGKKTDAPHDALYWRFGSQIAIRKGDWKLTKAREGRDQPLPRGPADTSGALLVNLREDIGEMRDRAAEQPDKFRELAAAWKQWNAELKEPTWGQPDRAQKRAKKKAKAD